MASKRSGVMDMDFQGPFRGLGTRPNPNLLGPAWFRDCQNVAIQGGMVVPYPPTTAQGSDIWGDGSTIASAFAFHFQPDSSGDVAPDWILLVRSSNTKLYLWQPGGSPTEVGNAPALDCSFMRLGPWVVVCGRGSTVMVKVNSDGTFTYRTAGFTRPATAPVQNATLVTDSLLVGAFDWVYTYYDSVNGYESAPSPVSTPASGNEFLIWFTFAAIPSGATHIRLYRRRIGSQMSTDSTGNFQGDGIGRSNNWYFVDEFPNNVVGRTGATQLGLSTTQVKLDAGASSVTDAYKNMRLHIVGGGSIAAAEIRKIIAYDGATKVATVSVAFSALIGAANTYYVSHDNTLDSELTERAAPFQNQKVDTTSTGTARTMLYCAYGVDRAFYSAGDNAIWYGELPRAGEDRNAFPSGIYVGDANFFIVDVSDGEFVTGLRWYDAFLIVLTNRGAFAADTSDLELGFARTRRLIRAAGCISHRSIQECPADTGYKGYLLWASLEGVQRFDGVGTTCISGDALFAFWPGLTPNLPFTRLESGIDNERGLYLIKMQSFVFCCDIASNSWTILTVDATSFWNAYSNETNPTLALHWGTSLGAVESADLIFTEYANGLVGGAGWNFTTQRLSIDSSAGIKKLADLVLSFDKTKTTTPTVHLILPHDEDGAPPTISCAVTPINTDLKKPLVTHCRATVDVTVDRIAFKVAGSCDDFDDFARLTGIGVDAVPAGVR